MSRTVPIGLPSPAPLDAKGPIWIAVVILITTLLPPEVRITLGGVELFSYRLAFLATLPFLIQGSPHKVRRLLASDLLVLSGAIWMIISMVANSGLASGLQRSLSVAMDLLSGYVVARASIASIRDLRRLLTIMAPIFCFAGSLVMIESLSNEMVVHPLVERVFTSIDSLGIVRTSLADYSTRLGLFRGVGAFPHPILGGLYLASLLPLYVTAGVRKWPRILGLLAAGMAFFTVSSTAFMLLAFGILLLLYDWQTQTIRALSWRTFLAALALLLACYQLFSPSGLIGLTVKLALDGGTAYYRVLLWQFAGSAAATHPVFGLGDIPFERPMWMVSNTIDNYWLLLAVHYGYVVPVSLLLAAIAVMFQLGRPNRLVRPDDARLLRGISVTIGLVVVGSFFVALFSGVQIWFAALLGCGANCALITRDTRIPRLYPAKRMNARRLAA